MKLNLLAVILILFLTVPLTGAADDSITVVMFNVESGGANIQTIADKCARMTGVDIIGLSEVESKSWSSRIQTALTIAEGVIFKEVTGTTGRGDRLAVVYDDSELDLMSVDELHDINPGNRVRSPLVCHFRHTSSDTQFLFCVNHLYRSRDAERHKQAQQLNEWVKKQTLPVIIGGDMNFDWSVANNGQHRDAGFDRLTDGGIVEWIRPDNIVKTHASNYNSILDFIFVTPNGPWAVEDSEIIVEDNDFPDTGWTSDHRPVAAVFRMDVALTRSTTQPAALQKPTVTAANSDAIEAELKALDELIARLTAAVEDLDESDRRTKAVKRALFSRIERLKRDSAALWEALERLVTD